VRQAGPHATMVTQIHKELNVAAGGRHSDPIKKSVAEIMRVTRFSVLQIGRRHQFSAAADAESYGLTYADHSPSADWESVVNGERDSIVNGFGGSVVDEKRTSVEGYPGKWTRFAGQDTRANSPSTSSGAACMCCTLLLQKGTPRPENFSTFLNLFLLLSKPKA
jgi:hypothetical protein